MARSRKSAKTPQKPRFPSAQPLVCDHYQRVMWSANEFFCLDCRQAYQVTGSEQFVLIDSQIAERPARPN